nr:single-stranded DNA-binding protein [Bacillus sp. T3]
MINQVTLVGRLTKDPELRMTTDGIPVTHITLAVSRQFKNQSGQIESDFVQCTLWRRTAANTALYCKKGAVVGITGRIQTRHYDNNEGRRVYVTEVIAESVQFLSKKSTSTVQTTAQSPDPSRSVPTLESSTEASASNGAPIVAGSLNGTSSVSSNEPTSGTDFLHVTAAGSAHSSNSTPVSEQIHGTGTVSAIGQSASNSEPIPNAASSTMGTGKNVISTSASAQAGLM